MRFSSLMPFAAVALLGFATSASALTITSSPNLVDFSYVAVNSTRTITIHEEWGPLTGRVVELRFDDLPLSGKPWTIIKVIKNNTGLNFAGFQFELLNADMSPSDNLDGLSFAQNANPPVTRASDVFSSVFVDELDDRDFLQFTGGTFASGTVGTFNFGITVTKLPDNNPFFLRQTAIVPEPATWAMLIAGFGMVGFAMRRRKTGLASVTA